MRKIVEIVWLAVAAVSLVEAVYNYKKSGFENDGTLMFLMVFALAVFMYFFRRFQRLKKG